VSISAYKFDSHRAVPTLVRSLATKWVHQPPLPPKPSLSAREPLDPPRPFPQLFCYEFELIFNGCSFCPRVSSEVPRLASSLLERCRLIDLNHPPKSAMASPLFEMHSGRFCLTPLPLRRISWDAPVICYALPKQRCQILPLSPLQRPRLTPPPFRIFRLT